jgi:CO dehydrogenase nickel-insertion accessory protein CooC1
LIAIYIISIVNRVMGRDRGRGKRGGRGGRGGGGKSYIANIEELQLRESNSLSLYILDMPPVLAFELTPSLCYQELKTRTMMTRMTMKKRSRDRMEQQEGVEQLLLLTSSGVSSEQREVHDKIEKKNIFFKHRCN